MFAARPALEAQKSRRASRLYRFCFVTRLRPVIRPLAPVGLVSGQPFECWVRTRDREHDPEVSNVIGGQTQFAAVVQDPGEFIHNGGGYQSAFVVAGFWPGVREQDKGAVETVIRQSRQRLSRVIVKNPEIGDLLALQPADELDDPRLKNLAADDSNRRVSQRLPGSMLTAAKSNLQPNGSVTFEKLVEVRQLVERDPIGGQAFGQRELLGGAQLSPAPAAVQLRGDMIGLVDGDRGDASASRCQF